MYNASILQTTSSSYLAKTENTNCSIGEESFTHNCRLNVYYSCLWVTPLSRKTRESTAPYVTLHFKWLIFPVIRFQHISGIQIGLHFYCLQTKFWKVMFSVMSVWQSVCFWVGGDVTTIISQSQVTRNPQPPWRNIKWFWQLRFFKSFWFKWRSMRYQFFSPKTI